MWWGLGKRGDTGAGNVLGGSRRVIKQTERKHTMHCAGPGFKKKGKKKWGKSGVSQGNKKTKNGMPEAKKEKKGTRGAKREKIRAKKRSCTRTEQQKCGSASMLYLDTAFPKFGRFWCGKGGGRSGLGVRRAMQDATLEPDEPKKQTFW